MAKLNPINLAGIELEKTKPPAETTPVAETAAVSKKASEGKPSPFASDLKAKLRDKTQFSFGHMPRFIVEIFEAQANKAGMNRREYLYSLLRDKGGNIPPYEQMDGRKL